jgi:glycosyltransferase involved in cell wall biosynthesis
MIKILICESGTGYGGSGAYLNSFLKHIDRNRFYPVVSFNERADGPFIEKIKKLNNIEYFFLSDKSKKIVIKYNKIYFIRKIQVIINLIKNNFIPIIKLISIIQKRKIDLILLNQDVVFHIPAIIASIVTRIPCVVRKGGVGVHPNKKIIWKILSYFPEFFVASSHAEYNFHIESGFPYKQMAIVYEGVDVSEFQPRPKIKNIHDEYSIPYDTKLIGLISRFDEGKGHEDVIAAAPEILKEFSQVIFLIVGDGEAFIKNKLIEQVKSLRLQDKIIFTGWRTDALDILNAIDIFVHCPNQFREGMGIATLEALASGKPVIITDNWGLSDTTEDGFNGFVVAIGDRKMICEKILRLLKDNELHDRMGVNSRMRALEFFDIRKNIKMIENIMLRTLA